MILKKRWWIFLPLILSFALTLSACSSLHKVTFDSQADTYHDTKTDITYTPLSASYEPIARGEEYARVNAAGVKTTLYQIVGLDPAHYLCSAYGDVFCDKSTTPPTFEAWEVSEMTVALNDGILKSQATLHATVAEEQSIIDSILAAYKGDLTISQSFVDIYASYILRFTSEDLPGICYSIRYYEYAEDIYTTVSGENGEEQEINLGKYFLFDRYAGRCVPMDDTLHAFLENTES